MLLSFFFNVYARIISTTCSMLQLQPCLFSGGWVWMQINSCFLPLLWLLPGGLQSILSILVLWWAQDHVSGVQLFKTLWNSSFAGFPLVLCHFEDKWSFVAEYKRNNTYYLDLGCKCWFFVAIELDFHVTSVHNGFFNHNNEWLWYVMWP